MRTGKREPFTFSKRSAEDRVDLRLDAREFPFPLQHGEKRAEVGVRDGRVRGAQGLTPVWTVTMPRPRSRMATPRSPAASITRASRFRSGKESTDRGRYP